MKKENKMYLLIIACAIIVYLLLRKPKTENPVTEPGKNARTGVVGDWSITIPPVTEPAVHFRVAGYGSVTPNYIDVTVQSPDSVSWIDFILLPEEGFVGYEYDVNSVITSGMAVRTSTYDNYRFNFADTVPAGNYVVYARPQGIANVYDYTYVQIEDDSTGETILTQRPGWVTDVDITRLNATNETSVWVKPSGVELRVSNKLASPQPTGKDHDNNTWTHETWQAGTAQYAGDYSRVYRLNPATPGTGGVQENGTYYFDFRRTAYPNTIFRIEYTVPNSDLMFVSLLPESETPVDSEDLQPYILGKGWVNHIDINVSGTPGNWILDDTAIEPLQSGYQWLYQVNGVSLRGNNKLTGYNYRSNEPLQIQKAMIRDGLTNLSRWHYPDAGWNLPDAGGTMSGNASVSFFSCVFK